MSDGIVNPSWDCADASKMEQQIQQQRKNQSQQTQRKQRERKKQQITTTITTTTSSKPYANREPKTKMNEQHKNQEENKLPPLKFPH
jgi:hypothetical protein